jgi:hypothetical protein
VVIAAAAAAAALLFFSPRIESDETQVEIPPPVVVGALEGSSVKNLDMGTTVDCNSLLVTVMESSQGPIASDGKPITAVRVQFLNKSTTNVMLYSTQWQLETTDGERIDCYIGRTEQGENIISDLDSQSLAPDASLTVTLYFAADAPARVVFAPNALSYSESGLVTWLLSGPENTTDAAGAGDGTDAAEGA